MELPSPGREINYEARGTKEIASDHDIRRLSEGRQDRKIARALSTTKRPGMASLQWNTETLTGYRPAACCVSSPLERYRAAQRAVG